MATAVAARTRSLRQCILQGKPEDPRTRALLETLWASLGDDSVLIAFDGGASEAFFRKSSEEIDAFDREFTDPRVFVCQNFTCQAPVSDAQELKGILA